MSKIQKDQAKNCLNYIGNMFEKIRQETDLLKIISFKEAGEIHIALTRLNNYLTDTEETENLVIQAPETPPQHNINSGTKIKNTQNLNQTNDNNIII